MCRATRVRMRLTFERLCNPPHDWPCCDDCCDRDGLRRHGSYVKQVVQDIKQRRALVGRQKWKEEKHAHGRGGHMSGKGDRPKDARHTGRRDRRSCGGGKAEGRGRSGVGWRQRRGRSRGEASSRGGDEHASSSWRSRKRITAGDRLLVCGMCLANRSAACVGYVRPSAGVDIVYGLKGILRGGSLAHGSEWVKG